MEEGGVEYDDICTLTTLGLKFSGTGGIPVVATPAGFDSPYS